MEFCERFKDLLIENGFKVNDVVSFLCKNPTTIYDWLRGKHLPRINEIFELSNLFKCSIDYLLCRTENYENLKPTKYPNIAQQIENVLKENNVTRYKLCKTKILTRGADYRIFYKNENPSTETVVKIADYLGVSVDYLVGRV